MRKTAAVAILSTVAMALNFMWFDLPGHGAAFLAHDLLLRESVADGHTLFLVGMLLASLVACAVPQRLARHTGALLISCAVFGTAAAALQFSDLSPAVSAVAAVVTGFTNIVVLIVEMLFLSHITDRKIAGLAVINVFVLRGLLMYGAETLVGADGELALFCLLPGLCSALTWAVVVIQRRADTPVERVMFQKPLSTAMLGLVVISSVAFAIGCAVGNTGFWGNAFALDGQGVVPVLIGSAAFFGISYLTLVKTESSLLLRFMPGLLVLFAVYLLLYSDTSRLFGFDASTLASIEHFAEYYAEEFSWLVILLALSTLKTPPWRVMGLSFSVNSGATVVFQYLILFDEGLNLVIVQLGFLAILAVLVWTLYHFYGIGSTVRDLSAVPSFSDDGALAITAEQDHDPEVPSSPSARFVTVSDPPNSESLRVLAKSLGLSEREIDVFLLLARGNSRRLICEKLFIADGTASTHIGRIYEKAHVGSKQELLSLVQEWEERHHGMS